MINTLIFSFVAVCLIYATLAVVQSDGPTYVSWIAVMATYLPLGLNIVHSQELSKMPKFLFKNESDAPLQQIEYFRKIFWRTSDGLTDRDIENIIPKEVSEEFKSIITVRAEKVDAEEIAVNILAKFVYIFEKIFKTKDHSLLNRAVVEILTVAGGFGSYGYRHFYLIESEGEKVGFVKIDTSYNCIIYRVVESLFLPFKLAKIFGPFSLSGIYRRTKEVVRSQPEPQDGEVRITYLIMFENYENKRYGSALLTLLSRALIHSVTNDIKADRLTLFVRESNTVAKKLFSKAGFKRKLMTGRNTKDPFAEMEKIGPSVSMEYTTKVE